MIGMRLCLLFTILAASCAASPLNDKSNSSRSNVQSEAGTPSCRAGFRYYKGFCVYTTDPIEITYNAAVDKCTGFGAFAPSIHSREDVDFWSDYASQELDKSYFWLDAYCPSVGRLYAWRDGTRTNYAGPNDEFFDCQLGKGFHMAYNGLDKEPYTDKSPGVCVYDPLDSGSTTTVEPPTTMKTSSPKPSTSSPTDDSCACNPSSIYLDIVVVLDASSQMSTTTVNAASAMIESALYGLTLGTKTFQSNVAALAYAESVQTVANFGDLTSSKDVGSMYFPYLGGSSAKAAAAINRASSMIAANARNSTRGVIVLLSNSYNYVDDMNIRTAADDFENNGGTLVTIDYSVGAGVDGLQLIANQGFYINDTSDEGALTGSLLTALCDANCFCRDGLISYFAANSRDRVLPTGCYSIADTPTVYYAAEQRCNAQRGFVSTIHDDTMNFFLTSLFPVKTPYWLGLERNATNGRVFDWADGLDTLTSPFTNWAPGNPVDGFNCVYSQQQTGFNSPWFSAPCNSPFDYSLAYACQMRPCSSQNDCWA